MKKYIQSIINIGAKIDPVSTLASDYDHLTDNEQKQEFISILKDLIINGNQYDKLISLNVLKTIEKAKDCEIEIKKIIDNLDFKQNEKIIPPLLFLSAALSTDWAIDFIKRVIKYFRPETKEYSRCFDMGLCSIVTTTYWKEIIDEIEWVHKLYDERYIVDFFAYFIWKRGIPELKEFKNNNFLYSEIIELQDKIIERYSNVYAQVKIRK